MRVRSDGKILNFDENLARSGMAGGAALTVSQSLCHPASAPSHVQCTARARYLMTPPARGSQKDVRESRNECYSRGDIGSFLAVYVVTLSRKAHRHWKRAYIGGRWVRKTYCRSFATPTDLPVLMRTLQQPGNVRPWSAPVEKCQKLSVCGGVRLRSGFGTRR